MTTIFALVFGIYCGLRGSAHLRARVHDRGAIGRADNRRRRIVRAVVAGGVLLVAAMYLLNSAPG
jgi:hypothetical protein